MGKESNLNRLMRERCAAIHGCVYYKNHGTQMGIAGRPDIEVFYSGKAVLIETKIGKNGLSPRQQVEHERLRDAGADVRICFSIGDFDDILNQMAGGQHESSKRTN